MIHYITIHFQSDEWVDIQNKHISQNTHDYKIWSYLGHIGDSRNIQQTVNKHKSKFHFLEAKHVRNNIARPSMTHWMLLDELTAVVINDHQTRDEDILVWLDSDCFPINDVNSYIYANLQQYPFCAVQRVENIRQQWPGGDLFPHPSFAFSTARFWKEHNLSWRGDQQQRENKIDTRLVDTGSYLLCQFVDKNIDWYPIRRSSSLTLERVFFTIYGGIVYHHSAGTRKNYRARMIVGSDEMLANEKVHIKYLQRMRKVMSDAIIRDIEEGLFLDSNYHKACNIVNP